MKSLGARHFIGFVLVALPLCALAIGSDGPNSRNIFSCFGPMMSRRNQKGEILPAPLSTRVPRPNYRISKVSEAGDESLKLSKTKMSDFFPEGVPEATFDAIGTRKDDPYLAQIEQFRKYVDYYYDLKSIEGNGKTLAFRQWYKNQIDSHFDYRIIKPLVEGDKEFGNFIGKLEHRFTQRKQPKHEELIGQFVRNPTVRSAVVPMTAVALGTTYWFVDTLRIAFASGPVGGVMNSFASPMTEEQQATAKQIGTVVFKHAQAVQHEVLEPLKPGISKNELAEELANAQRLQNQMRAWVAKAQSDLERTPALERDQKARELSEEYIAEHQDAYFNLLRKVQTTMKGNVRDGRQWFVSYYVKEPVAFFDAVKSAKGVIEAHQIRKDLLYYFGREKVESRINELKAIREKRPLSHEENQELSDNLDRLQFGDTANEKIRKENRELAAVLLAWKIHDAHYADVVDPLQTRTPAYRMRESLGLHDYYREMFAEIQDLKNVVGDVIEVEQKRTGASERVGIQDSSQVDRSADTRVR